MPVLKNVLGLDLGSHSIKAVELRQHLRGIEAVQMRVLPRSEDDLPLQELVRGFVEMHGLGTGHVVAALPGDRVASRLLEFPFRERKRLNAAVPFELANVTPYELDDYLIDWSVANEDKARAEVVASIAPRAEVAGLIQVLAEAGAEPRTVEAEGTVLANLAGAFDLAGPRLVADLGHRKSTLCVVVDGQPVAARTLPVGGAAITKAIATERGLSLEEAERRKCEEGAAGSDGTQAVIERLAQEMVRTLGSVEALLGRAGVGAIGEITLLGGGAQLLGLDELLTDLTGVPARRLGLPIEGESEGLAAGGSPLVFGPAIALALRGTARARTSLDFRQGDLAVRMDLSGLRRNFGWTGVWASAAAVLAIASFGTGLVLESRRAGDLQGQLLGLYEAVKPGQPLPSNPVSAMRQAVEDANDQAEFLGVYPGNLSALDLLAEVSRRVPADLKISVEEISIDGKTIRMRCNTENFEAADRLNAELAKVEAFGSTRIGSIETDRKTNAKRFNVTISLATPESA